MKAHESGFARALHGQAATARPQADATPVFMQCGRDAPTAFELTLGYWLNP